jgi:hypothetical protein
VVVLVAPVQLDAKPPGDRLVAGRKSLELFELVRVPRDVLRQRVGELTPRRPPRSSRSAASRSAATWRRGSRRAMLSILAPLAAVSAIDGNVATLASAVATVYSSARSTDAHR